MKPIDFDSEAKEELKSALEWYERQRPGLGDGFLAEVEKSADRIARSPEAYPIDKQSGYRKCVVRRFPYTIYFRELEDRIWIAAVAHQRRLPHYWWHRKPD